VSKYHTTKAYGDCEGPLGFPMRSDCAQELEAEIDALPADCKELIQDGPMRITCMAKGLETIEGERADVSTVTTEAVDRDGEVIMALGGDWGQFRKNPVVPFAHDYRSLPVGRALWVKRTSVGGVNRGWIAKTQYTPAPEGWAAPWLPDAVWHMVKSGDLPGKSIGFIPREVRAPSESEKRARPELASVSRVITKWLALEYSVVPVQSNPDAIVQAISKSAAGALLTPALEAWGIIIPDVKDFSLDSATEAEPEIEVPAYEPRIVDPSWTRKQVAAMAARAFSRGQHRAEAPRVNLATKFFGKV